MTNVLAQLDRGLGMDDDSFTNDLPPAFFSEAERVEKIHARFGFEPALEPFLLRIASVVDFVDAAVMPEEIAEIPNVKELRLEPWEVAAYQKLFERRPAEADEDNEELWTLYVRAAALRLRVDGEATMLAAAIGTGIPADAEVLGRAKESLDYAKELDESFSAFLREAVYYANPKILHQLYRSRFRLLRGFSGLWLIYDRGGHHNA
jgi:hypothetical protein